MEPIMFASPEKNQEFQKCLEGVLSEPYIILVRNENGKVQPVSLFNKSYSNPGIAINSPLSNLTYEELCFLFLQPVSIGLLVVRILQCENQEAIMAHMRFDFLDKDGRHTMSHNPVLLCEDPDQYEPVMFLPIDIVIKPLTYINFNLPKGAEIELMLFPKRPVPEPEVVHQGENSGFGS